MTKGSHHQFLIPLSRLGPFVLQADEGVNVSLAEDVVPAADVDHGRFDLRPVVMDIPLAISLAVVAMNRPRHVRWWHPLGTQPFLVQVLQEHAARIARVPIRTAVRNIHNSAHQVGARSWRPDSS